MKRLLSILSLVAFVLAGFLVLARPGVVLAELSGAKINALALAVNGCVATPPPNGCFESVPSGTVDYTMVYNEWINQLKVGRIPAPLVSYSNKHIGIVILDVNKPALIANDLRLWKVLRDTNATATINPTPEDTTDDDSGSAGGTAGGTTGGTTGGEPTAARVVDLAKPSDHADKALDTANFLQEDSLTYGWSADVWQAMRQMSNIMIVVFLFLGALATTLNYNLNTYGIKRVLPSVLQAAILANFSYIVINVAIEVVGLTQQGLLGIGTGGAKVEASTWDQLAAPLKSILDSMKPTGSSSFAELAWWLIAALVVGVAMLMLWVLIAILYLRSFVIAMLLAFAPIAILSMALPATQGIWKKWWEEFLKWLLLPLIVSFWLMIAALVAGLSLPPLLLTAVLMYVVWQAIKVPFSFKPMIAGAALGYGASQLTNLGRNVGTRAVYGNNLTGGALRGVDRWKQNRSASLGALKDSSTVFKGVRPAVEAPGPDASRMARFRYAVGFRGALGRRLNAGFEEIDSNVEEFKEGEAISKTYAKTQSDQYSDLRSPMTRGQRKAAQQLEKARVEGLQGVQSERDAEAAAEADPDILREIASLNITKDNITNALESLKTGAKGAALAADDNLKAEKKLSEFRKSEAANYLKQIEAGINNDAINENSPLGKILKARLGGDDNANLRRVFETYGVHIGDDGSGYVEGMMQNDLNAATATEAYEKGVKRQQTLIAARDSSRHKKVLDATRTKDAQGNRIDFTTQTEIKDNLDTAFSSQAERVAAAEHLEKQLRITMSREQMEQYGVTNLVDTVKNGDKDDADELLARSINLYNATDMGALSQASVPGLSEPVSEEALKAARNNRIAASIRQGSMVREDMNSGTTALSETSFPEDRAGRLEDTIKRVSPGLGLDEIRATHALSNSKIAGEGIIDERLTGTAHHELMGETTKMIRSWRKDAYSGDNGEPSSGAVNELSKYLDETATTLRGYQARLDPQDPDYARWNQEFTDTIDSATAAKDKIEQAYAQYKTADQQDDYGKKQSAKSVLRQALGDKWLAKF